MFNSLHPTTPYYATLQRNLITPYCYGNTTTPSNTLYKVYHRMFNYTHNTSPPNETSYSPPPSPVLQRKLFTRTDSSSSKSEIDSCVLKYVFTAKLAEQHIPYIPQLHMDTCTVDSSDIPYTCPVAPRSNRSKPFTFDVDYMTLYNDTDTIDM